MTMAQNDHRMGSIHRSVELTFTRNGGGVYSDTKTIDLQGVLSSNIAFIGFTSATGGSKNLQQVRFDNNTFCIADEILTPSATYEVSE